MKFKILYPMKKLFFLAFLLSGITIYAQHPQKANPDKLDREKIESMKVAFLTEKMDLTPEEAQKFWPIYNQYKNEMKALRNEKKELSDDSITDFKSMSDAQALKLIDEKLVLDQKLVDIKKKYHQQYKNIFSPQKVAMLYHADNQFKAFLLKKGQQGDSEKGQYNHKK